MAENIAAMKLDVSGLLNNTGFGVSAVFKHFSGATTATGRKSGAWVAYASNVVMVQDLGGRSYRDERGLVDNATHVMFIDLSQSCYVEDRIAVSGDTYEYDVVSIDQFPTHKEVRMKRVLRTA